MRLRFPEFGAQLIAWALHQWVAVSATLQDAWFDPSEELGTRDSHLFSATLIGDFPHFPVLGRFGPWIKAPLYRPAPPRKPR